MQMQLVDRARGELIYYFNCAAGGELLLFVEVSAPSKRNRITFWHSQ
jgi:hypothetical protein